MSRVARLPFVRKRGILAMLYYLCLNVTLYSYGAAVCYEVSTPVIYGERTYLPRASVGARKRESRFILSQRS